MHMVRPILAHTSPWNLISFKDFPERLQVFGEAHIHAGISDTSFQVQTKAIKFINFSQYSFETNAKLYPIETNYQPPMYTNHVTSDV